MRLEINIADERPEAKILGAVEDPSAYLMSLVRIYGSPRAPQVGGAAPNYAEIFAEAQHCPSAFKSKEEIDDYIDRLRNEW